MGARGTVRRVLGAALLAAGLSGVALVGAAVPANALSARANGCDSAVVDGAHMLGDGKAASRAAAALATHHATVRVRTYSSVPDGDLDAAIAAETSRCASWHDRDGRRRADLLVLAVSLKDRHTGVYYGTGWTAALDDHQEDVQTGTVNPLLRRGKYAAAVTGGLTALGRLLPARPAQAADVVTDTTVDPAGDPAVSDVDLPDEDVPGLPGDGAGGALGVLVVVGIVGAVGSMVAAAARGGRRAGRGRSSRSWNSNDGIDHGYAGGFGSASGFSGSGFSGGSDAGSSSSSSSDGGGSSTSW